MEGAMIDFANEASRDAFDLTAEDLECITGGVGSVDGTQLSDGVDAAADARKSGGGGNASGAFFLHFQFKLVAVKTVS
jgi:hypothetical protein